MFEKLRNAFREAIDNFHEELNRDRVPDAVDSLLKGMRDEVTDAKLRLGELERQITTALSEAEAEANRAATARRRGAMAGKIDDEETAKVADEFAQKHARRQALLERKALALKDELEFRQAEYQDMLAQIKEASSRRDALAAQSGRAGARSSLDAADDLFAELDRMADKISDEDARARAAEHMDDLDLEGDDYEPAPGASVDARLEALKRKMGRDD